jgi:hypothetical protein
MSDDHHATLLEVVLRLRRDLRRSLEPIRVTPFLPLARCSSFGLLITFLLLCAAPVYAEWVVVGTNIKDDTIYINPGTIRRNGEVVELWVIIDSRLAQRLADTTSFFLSVRQLHQYNCGEERLRILATTWFTGNMGNGAVLENLVREGPWKPIPPDSVGRHMMELVCAK